MGDITRIYDQSHLDTPVETVLQNAIDTGLTEVVVVGFDKNEQTFFASSKADGGDVLWHLARAQHQLMTIADEMYNDS